MIRALKTRSLWSICTPEHDSMLKIQEDLASEQPKITGEVTEGVKKSAPLLAKLKQQSEFAMDFIQSTLEPQDLISTGNCETAAEMWLHPEASYQGLNRNACERAQRKFYSLKFEESTGLSDLVSKYEQALSNLDLVNSSIDEGRRVRFFITILPEKYQSYATIWELMNKAKDPVTARLHSSRISRLKKKNIEKKMLP